MRPIFNFRAVLLASLIASASIFAMAAGNHEHSAKFGGVVVETKAGDMEIVARTDSIRIYFTDHGKAAKLDHATAKVTLLNGSEKSEVELTASGDKLEAKGTFKVTKGTKGIAVLMLTGKPPVTARFELK